MIFGPAVFDGDVSTLDKAGFGQPSAESRRQCLRITRGPAADKSDHRHCRLLPPRREWPRRRAAEQRDELAPPHSITSSAATCSVGGTARPSALAVLRFITNSNLVGCKTGKSAGFSPLRIRPV